MPVMDTESVRLHSNLQNMFYNLLALTKFTFSQRVRNNLPVSHIRGKSARMPQELAQHTAQHHRSDWEWLNTMRIILEHAHQVHMQDLTSFRKLIIETQFLIWGHNLPETSEHVCKIVNFLRCVSSKRFSCCKRTPPAWAATRSQACTFFELSIFFIIISKKADVNKSL